LTDCARFSRIKNHTNKKKENSTPRQAERVH